MNILSLLTKKGNWDCNILPNLFQSAVFSQASNYPVGGAASTQSISGGVYSDNNWQRVVAPTAATSGNTVTTNCPSIRGCMVIANMSQKMESLRIVGYGVRVRCLTAPLNQSGRVIFSATPSSRDAIYAPPNDSLYDDVCNYFDFAQPDASGYITTELLNGPDSIEVMTSDLSIRGGVEWTPKIVSPEAFQFRTCTPLSNATALPEYGLSSGSSSIPSLYFQVASNQTGVTITFPVASDYLAYVRPIVGMSLYAVGANNLPTGSSLGTILR
mgnify:CR=1 FL=1